MAGKSQIRIGISGWTYPSWRGPFYPRGLQQRRELHYASRQFNSIEINSTFYRLQNAARFRHWYAETPDDFVFSVKGGRFITHMKKLNDVGPALANFFASGPLALQDKLGPILWQLPAQFRFDAVRLENFFRLLPRDTHAAASLALRHDRRLATGDAWAESDVKRPLRHALEVRHDNFRTPQFIELLRRWKVALVFTDAVGWPYMEDVTADFVYLRLHGSEELYVSGYSDTALDGWAARIRAWASGAEPADAKRIAAPARPRSRRDVYVYFDNDAKVRAPFDAMNLAGRLSTAAEPWGNS